LSWRKDYALGIVRGSIEAYLRGDQAIEWTIDMIKHGIRSDARIEEVIKIIEKYKKNSK